MTLAFVLLPPGVAEVGSFNHSSITFNCLLFTTIYVLTTADLRPWSGVISLQDQKIISVFFFPLFSGNHSGSDWSHHGQPHLLHMSRSHLQKDPEEWHHRSGDRISYFPDNLLSENVHSF